MKFLIILILCLSLLSGCGNNELMKQIESYHSDGDIKFIDAPGPLGRPGISISFPPFDLSKEFSKSYNITGIPKGEAYLIYLVISESNSGNKISTAICSYKITRNGNPVSNITSKIKNMTKTVGDRVAQYYFYDKNSGPEYFNIDEPTAKWTLSVSYDKPNELNSGKAFYMVKTGGSK
jgi:hypothetical protein